ncbi:hypothetical protein V8G54_024705 [Vigna mungo]|uniref:Copia protein n=1 Tax=Vigna mungo TaxID=3915 RepID=A0AAQ3N6D4_VIGMU
MAEPILVGFSDSDYEGCKIHSKSIGGTCHLLRRSLVTVAPKSLKCDTNAINLTKNPIMHSTTKHIKIKHHFLRDRIQKGDYEIEYVDTKHQLVDIFTKALPKDRFYEIRRLLCILIHKFEKVKGVDIVLDDDIWTTVAQIQVNEDVVMLTHELEGINKILAFRSFLMNHEISFILQGNTYIHRDDVKNLEDKDVDQQMNDIQDEAGLFAATPTSSYYSLESLSRQLSHMSLLQACRHEEVYSLLKSLDDRVHALEHLVQPLDDGHSD